MSNKYLRSTIIAMLQCILPVLLLLVIAPLLINHMAEITQLQKFIEAHRVALLFTHGLFYLSIFYLWPHIIKQIISSQNDCPKTNQIKIANSARWYLLTAIAFFELLVYWG